MNAKGGIKTMNDFLLNSKPINFYQIQTFPTNKSLQIQTFTKNKSQEVYLNIQYLGLNCLKKYRKFVPLWAKWVGRSQI